jgi:hypothetical protein
MALSAFLLIGTLLLVDWGAARMEEGEIDQREVAEHETQTRVDALDELDAMDDEMELERS